MYAYINLFQLHACAEEEWQVLACAILVVMIQIINL